LGRGCGGFATKIHACVNPLGQPVALELTAGQCADSPQLPGLIVGVKTQAVLADKGYDSESNRAAIRNQGAEPCIPGKRNRKEPIAYDHYLYKERNVVERFFARIKQYRRVATRYDKTARNYLGFVWVASLKLLLA
jgi:transposase